MSKNKGFDPGRLWMKEQMRITSEEYPRMSKRDKEEYREWSYIKGFVWSLCTDYSGSEEGEWTFKRQDPLEPQNSMESQLG